MVVGGLALVAGGAIIAATSGSSVTIPPTPPAPGASAAPGAGAAPIAVTQAASTCSAPKPKSASNAPVRVCIPAIGVDASVIQLGVNSDHTLEVPSLKQVADAAWDKYSPPPGTDGPAIIVGHIDSAKYGQGVFFNLGRLHAGDAIIVARGDGSVASFHVVRVAEYPKSSFPTKTVYGDTSGSTIRLITCGGRFDSRIGSYVDNIVVYGTLKSVT